MLVDVRFRSQNKETVSRSENDIVDFINYRNFLIVRKHRRPIEKDLKGQFDKTVGRI